jgi:glycosyltransferase involved in cell wall biosynthesis
MAYKVDITIPVWNQCKYTRMLLESLLTHTDPEKTDYRIIIVDNGSTDDTPALLAEMAPRFPNRFHVITNTENKGWCVAINQGYDARRPGSDYFLMLNNDILITKNDWLFDLIDPIADRPEFAGSGPVSNAVAGLQSVLYNNPRVQTQEALYLIGFAFLLKCQAIEVIRKLDGFFVDELFNPGGAEEIDICMRLSARGYKFFINRRVYLHHFLSKTLSVVAPDLQAFHIKHMNLLYQKYGKEEVLAFMGNTHKRVLLAIPTLGQVHWKFLMTLITLEKPEGVIIEVHPRSLPDIARNNLAEVAMGCGADYIMYIDDDMIFDNQNLLMKFMGTMAKRPDIDVLSAVAHTRNAPFNPCVFKATGDEPYYNLVSDFKKGLIEVDATTCACTLIRTELFRKMHKAMGHIHFFDFVWVGKIRMGEDVGFCYNAKKYANARIWIDSDECVHHIGENLVISRKTHDAYREHAIIRETLKF